MVGVANNNDDPDQVLVLKMSFKLLSLLLVGGILIIDDRHKPHDNIHICRKDGCIKQNFEL